MTALPSLRNLVDSGVVPIGVQSFTANHTLIEVLGACGFDYVWLDTEHSPLDPRRLEDTMRACEVAGLLPLVRIPEPRDHTSARRALEAGAHAIVIPMVRSAEDVEELVRALKFPPSGTRGLCPALRPNKFSVTGMETYMRRSDESLVVIPMIETVEGLAEVEAICAIPEVQFIVFASGELAHAMDEGTNMHSSPKIQAALEVVQWAADRHDVAVIGGPILDPTGERCAQALNNGIRVLCLGLDVMMFRQVAEAAVKAAFDGVNLVPAYSRPQPPASGFPAHY